MRAFLAGLGTVAIAATSLAVAEPAFATASSAVNVDYADFSSVAGIAMVGTTSIAAGSAMQTTNSTDGNQAGGFWLTTPIDTTRDFSSHFRYLTIAGAGTVGDGFTFTVQNVGTSALGSCGAGLGYTTSACDASAAISPSEAYAFDAAAGNKVFDGSDGTLTDAGTTYADPHDGTIEQAWVDYAAATHELTLFTAAANAPKPATPTAQRTIADLSTWTGSTYLGFTGGTSTDVLEQDVKSWSVHQPLEAPASVTAAAGAAGAAAGHATVDVSWDPPADDPNSTQVTSYTVYRSTSPSTRGTAIGTIGASPFTDDAATGGTSYYYTVTDTANGMESPGTTSSQVTAAKTLPSAPVDLAVDSTVSGPAVPTGGGSVTLTWSAPTDLGGDASVTYDVFRSVNGAAFVKVGTAISTTGYTDDNLDAAHYAYKVEAVNSQGNGPDSTTVTADIATIVTAPGGPSATAPSDPTLAVDGKGRTVLSWTAPTDTSGSTVDHYTVYRAIGNETAPSTSFSVYQDNVTATSLPTQTLTAGTGFVSYNVVAVLANTVTSPHSGNATVFIPEAPVVATVTNPSNGHVVVTGSIANVPNGVSVSYAALAFNANHVCTTCVSTPDGNGADIAGIGSGNWQFRLVPTTTYGDGTALGPASSLSTPALTLHTIRYASAAIGVDNSDCTVVGSPCATITRALAQATAGDEVLVSPGTYAEGADISTTTGPIAGSFGFHYTGAAITKPVQLVANSSFGNPVVIDATGHNNGLVIDLGDNFDNSTGHSSSGPAVTPDVRVSGFTIENANAEGLFAFNSDALRIDTNTIQDNDKGSFAPGVADDLGECATDCGDGLHLDGITRSVVMSNTVQDNGGGILVDDSLANYPQVSVPNEGNTIIHNFVADNSLGSGITLAGRDRSTLLGGFSLGVFDNAITNNTSSGNGTAGHGAGILLTIDAPGDGVYQNTLRGNVLANDSLPGITMHSRDALAYMDDNVIESNQIMSTGLGGIDGIAGDATAGVSGTAGIVVLGVASNPVGGTIIRDNAVSAVHYGVFLNEASSNFAGNGYTGVSVPVTTVPGPQNVYVGRGTNGHLYVNRGSIGRASDLGGALASPPAVGAIPTWNANAFGAGHGYWTNQMSPIYVARMTSGRIAVRSDSVSWANLPVPTSSGRAVALAGSPAVAGSSALDNGLSGGGRAVVGIAALSTGGDLWLTSVLIGPSRNVAGISKPWHNYGHPAGTALTGTPALTGLFFTNTAWAAAKNGYLYSMSFDPSTADWHGIGKPWIRHGYRAITVAGSTSPDGYRTALVLGNPNGTHPGLKLTELVYVSGVAGRLTGVSPISYGQPAVAVATNGVTVAYPATGSVLLTTGAVAKNYRTVMVGGVGAVALN